MNTLDQVPTTKPHLHRKRRLVAISVSLVFICLVLGWCSLALQDMYPKDFSDCIVESKSLNVFICAYSVVPVSIYPPNLSGVSIKEIWLEHPYVLTHSFPWGTTVSVKHDKEQLNISFGHSVSYVDSVGSVLFSGPNIGYSSNLNGPMWSGGNDLQSLPYKGHAEVDTFRYVFYPHAYNKPQRILGTFMIKKQFDSIKR